VVVDVNGETVTVKYKYDDSTADVARADVRGKPSAEAMAAREQQERLSSWHTWAILGDEEHRKEASRRMMANVECAEAGTYIGSGAVMPLSEEDQALLTLEVQRLSEKSRWEEKKWQEDKWDSSKKDEWAQPQKWGEDKKGGWQDGDSSGSKWENSATRGGDKDENATSWSDAQWNSGGGSSRGDGSWKQEGQSWEASGSTDGNKRDWDSAASSWQPDKRQRSEQGSEQPAPSSAATSQSSRASQIRPAAKSSLIRPVLAALAQPLKAGLVRPSSSPTAQPAKVARTSFGGGAKW